MTDGLEDLERRVAGLIERHRDAKQKIHLLEGRLEESVAECQRLGCENEQLRARVGELENELASRNSREDVVKNRLQQILSQIDSLETEVAEIESAGDES